MNHKKGRMINDSKKDYGYFRYVAKDIMRLKTPTGGVWSGIVLIDGQEKVLIDSGDRAEIIDTYLLPALEHMGYRLSDIKYLCNTHSHGDHIGGHYRIRELSEPVIAAYEKSVNKLRNPLEFSRKIRQLYPENSPPPPAVLMGVETDRILVNEEFITPYLQLLAAPGHDNDCVCFLDHRTRTLVSGDSLQGNGTETQGTALYMDVDAYRDTLQYMMKLKPDNIIAAHPYLQVGEGAEGEWAAMHFLDCCMQVTLEYESFIRNKMVHGECDAVKIAKELIDFVGNQQPDYLFLPLYTVTAHMKKIQNQEDCYE